MPARSASTPSRHHAAGAAGSARPGANRTSPLGPASAGVRAENRAEDEAYLAIVSLLEQGRAVEARAAALDYLVRFPQGFRRVEVAEVAKR
jgi:hypothetical protein